MCILCYATIYNAGFNADILYQKSKNSPKIEFLD